MAQQFTTAPTSPNYYVTHTINNIALINTLTNERKDWSRNTIGLYKKLRQCRYTIATAEYHQTSRGCKYTTSRNRDKHITSK